MPHCSRSSAPTALRTGAAARGMRKDDNADPSPSLRFPGSPCRAQSVLRATNDNGTPVETILPSSRRFACDMGHIIRGQCTAAPPRPELSPFSDSKTRPRHDGSKRHQLIVHRLRGELRYPCPQYDQWSCERRIGRSAHRQRSGRIVPAREAAMGP